MNATIYALVASDELGRFRYIGITTCALDIRLRGGEAAGIVKLPSERFPKIVLAPARVGCKMRAFEINHQPKTQ